MPRMIRSLCSIPGIKGTLIEKPLVGHARLKDAQGEDLYKCPHCGNLATLDDCDVCGAELEHEATAHEMQGKQYRQEISGPDLYGIRILFEARTP